MSVFGIVPVSFSSRNPTEFGVPSPTKTFPLYELFGHTAPLALHCWKIPPQPRPLGKTRTLPETVLLLTRLLLTPPVVTTTPTPAVDRAFPPPPPLIVLPVKLIPCDWFIVTAVVSTEVQACPIEAELPTTEVLKEVTLSDAAIIAVNPLASNVLPVIDDPETPNEYPPLPPFSVSLQVLLLRTTRLGVSPPNGPISTQKLFPARMVLFTTFVPLTDSEPNVEWKPMACAPGAP